MFLIEHLHIIYYQKKTGWMIWSNVTFHHISYKPSINSTVQSVCNCCHHRPPWIQSNSGPLMRRKQCFVFFPNATQIIQSQSNWWRCKCLIFFLSNELQKQYCLMEKDHLVRMPLLNCFLESSVEMSSFTLKFALRQFQMFVEQGSYLWGLQCSHRHGMQFDSLKILTHQLTRTVININMCILYIYIYGCFQK